MSKEKVRDIRDAKAAKAFADSVSNVPVVDVAPVAPPAPAPVVQGPVPVPAVQEKLQEQDRMMLELAKSRKGTAEAQAKEAVAKAETADLAYRYLVLQIFTKYGMNAADALTEGGDIIRGGAIPQGQTR